MGFFNNTNDQKPAKVQKVEEKEDAKPIARPSKDPSNRFNGTIFRAMPQFQWMSNQLKPSLDQTQLNYRYPYFSPQPARTFATPMWTNGVPTFHDRSTFPHPPALNIYQQGGWPSFPASMNGYMRQNYF